MMVLVVNGIPVYLPISRVAVMELQANTSTASVCVQQHGSQMQAALLLGSYYPFGKRSSMDLCWGVALGKIKAECQEKTHQKEYSILEKV